MKIKIITVIAASAFVGSYKRGGSDPPGGRKREGDFRFYAPSKNAPTAGCRLSRVIRGEVEGREIQA